MVVEVTFMKLDIISLMKSIEPLNNKTLISFSTSVSYSHWPNNKDCCSRHHSGSTHIREIEGHKYPHNSANLIKLINARLLKAKLKFIDEKLNLHTFLLIEIETDVLSPAVTAS